MVHLKRSTLYISNLKFSEDTVQHFGSKLDSAYKQKVNVSQSHELAVRTCDASSSQNQWVLQPSVLSRK